MNTDIKGFAGRRIDALVSLEKRLDILFLFIVA
jgi:hypothetical protein